MPSHELTRRPIEGGVLTRPFRFAAQIANASSRDEWLQQARLAEQLGYSVCVMPDHVGALLAPLPALVVVAEATHSIRIGTQVLAGDFRHPLLLAQEAATVDLLCDGRLELGLGTGWMAEDYERLGLALPSGRERLQRFSEALDIIEAYLVGDPFSFTGAHFTVGEVDPVPRAAQRPRPPILVGGGGPRILELAARRADIVSVFFRSLSDGSGFDLAAEGKTTVFDAKIALIRRAAAGREPEPELNVLLQHFEITNRRSAAARDRAVYLGIEASDVLELPFGLIGTLDQMTEDLLERRDRYGISYVTVREMFIRAFAPLVERLSGR